MLPFAAVIAASVAAGSPVYALVVANNQSNDAKIPALKFADDDGARYFTAFSAVAQEAVLLSVLDEETQRRFPGLAAQTRPPTKQALLESLAALNARMQAARASGERPVFYFVFTGHGQRGEAGEGSIALLGQQFTRTELYEELLKPLQATTSHLIIDACDSYFLVNQRGSLPSGPSQAAVVGQFLDARSLERFPDVGVVLSTSSEQESHEWSAISAGVFSHEVLSAMLGGADVNADGKVEYSELRAFVAAANQQVEDPRGRVAMFARPPARDRSAPLTDHTRSSALSYVYFPVGVRGRHWVEDARGVRFADFNKETDLPLVLALPPSRSFFLRGGGLEARVDTSPTTRVFDAGQLGWAAAPLAARGGSLDQSFREHLFETPFGARFYSGFVTSSGEVAVTPRARPDLAP